MEGGQNCGTSLETCAASGDVHATLEASGGTADRGAMDAQGDPSGAGVQPFTSTWERKMAPVVLPMVQVLAPSTHISLRNSERRSRRTSERPKTNPRPLCFEKFPELAPRRSRASLVRRSQTFKDLSMDAVYKTLPSCGLRL